MEGTPVQKIHETVDFKVDYEEVKNTKEEIDCIIEDFI